MSQLNQSQWLKPYVEFNSNKRIETEKNCDTDGEALCKLMNNVLYGKTIEKLRNRIYIRLVSNENDYLKWTSKPNYISQKIIGNDLIAIC